MGHSGMMLWMVVDGMDVPFLRWDGMRQLRGAFGRQGWIWRGRAVERGTFAEAQERYR